MATCTGENSEEICSTELPVYPHKCTVEGEGLTFGEVDKTTQVTVTIHHEHGESSTDTQTIKGELKSLVDRSTVAVKVVHQNSHTYTLQYTPKVRGRHHLSITVNGGHINGSPFSVFVRIPPTKLGRLDRVIEGVVSPCYIAFNSSEEMIVSEIKSGFQVLDREGVKLHTVALVPFILSAHCEGVAVDQDDNIYISYGLKNCLVKLNKEREVVKMSEPKVGSGDVQPYPLKGVAVNGDQVLACDCWNNRVLVFNRELEFVKEIQNQFDNPQGISTDRQGNIYVCDTDNSRVQILTREGEYLDSIDGKVVGEDKLAGPTGVCVEGDYVYVVDCSNSHVSVFTREGDHVTVLAAGQLQDPYGIAIDADGFVYVCNSYYGVDKIVVL